VAPRLVVTADPKMLSALSAGLREGGRFEVTALPLSDLGAVQAAATVADALAVFYGSAERPLIATLQEAAPAVRERGVRVVAVLQKDQTPMRDDCFRAGASEVLFMPMPREQFVQRLADAVGLSFAGEGGRPAQEATVSTRTASLPLEAAALTPSGLVAPAGPELGAGQSVRLAWSGGGASFSAWGLVVRSGPEGARFRLAGQTPLEETRLREWLAGGKVSPQPPPLAPPSWANVRPLSDARAATLPDSPAAGTHPPPAEAPAAAPVLAPPGEPAAAPLATAVSAVISNPGFRIPTAGPPPGFAARPPVRPQQPQQPRASSKPTVPVSMSGKGGPLITPSKGVPFITPSKGTPVVPPAPVAPPGAVPSAAPGATAPEAAASAPSEAAAAPAPLAPAVPSPPALAAMIVAPDAPAAAGQPAPVAGPVATAVAGSEPGAAAAGEPGLSALFDDVGAGTAAQPAPSEPAPAAPVPSWPAAPDLAVYKDSLAVMLKDRNLPHGADPELQAAFLKVCGGLSSVERETLEKLGAESIFHEALQVRAALAYASSAGLKLAGLQPPPEIDQAQVAQLTQLADAAGKKLQAEADRAIGKGEVEALQLVTAASGALSREQLSFKEVVDRLRGLAAAPRLGAGALDPDVQIPGQQQRLPQQQKQAEKAETQKRAELKDFEGFTDAGTAKRRKRALYVMLGVFVLSLVNLFVFQATGMKTANASLVEAAGTGVLQIQVAETTALVKVTKNWFNNPNRKQSVKQLCDALASRKTLKAVVEVDGGGVVGVVEVQNNCRSTLNTPPPPKEPKEQK
jgi:DNA-binding NarL/FixJ family response regulator